MTNPGKLSSSIVENTSNREPRSTSPRPRSCRRCPRFPQKPTRFRQVAGRSHHPLTSRVAVNRMWQYLFGTGLVKTSEDFGVQSEVPTHKDLLDWLAVEFRESGWNVKAFYKLLLTSDAYTCSAQATRESLSIDPENRLLSQISPNSLARHGPSGCRPENEWTAG